MISLLEEKFGQVHMVNPVTDLPKILELIKTSSGRLVIVMTDFLSIDTTKIVKQELEKKSNSKFIIITESKCDLDTLDNVDCLVASYFLYDVMKKIYKINIPFQKYKRKKPISFINAGKCKDRSDFASALNYHGLLDFSNYTLNYSPIGIFGEHSNNKIYGSLFETKSQLINSRQIDIDQKFDYRRDYDKNLPAMEKVIGPSNLYLGLENAIFHCTNAVSEKTIYGFLFRRITLPICGCHAISEIEKFGFVGFDPLLQWKTNNIQDPEIRTLELIKQISIFITCPQDVVDDWYVTYQKEIDHNYDIARNLDNIILERLKDQLRDY